MNIVKEIKAKVSELSLTVDFLEPLECEKFYLRVCEKFSQKRYLYPLWEHLTETASLNDPGGWKYINDFVGSDRAFFFLEKADENFVCIFQKGTDITLLLSECFAFVFYIVDDKLDFLICFNDHDFLIGAGTAKKWINILSS